MQGLGEGRGLHGSIMNWSSASPPCLCCLAAALCQAALCSRWTPQVSAQAHAARPAGLHMHTLVHTLVCCIRAVPPFFWKDVV